MAVWKQPQARAKEWVRLCANKTLFKNSVIWLDLADSYSWLISDLVSGHLSGPTASSSSRCGLFSSTPGSSHGQSLCSSNLWGLLPSQGAWNTLAPDRHQTHLISCRNLLKRHLLKQASPDPRPKTSPSWCSIAHLWCVLSVFLIPWFITALSLCLVTICFPSLECKLRKCGLCLRRSPFHPQRLEHCLVRHQSQISTFWIRGWMNEWMNEVNEYLQPYGY